MILACTVLIQITSVTDRQTPRRWQRHVKHSAFARNKTCDVLKELLFNLLPQIIGLKSYNWPCSFNLLSYVSSTFFKTKTFTINTECLFMVRKMPRGTVINIMYSVMMSTDLIVHCVMHIDNTGISGIVQTGAKRIIAPPACIFVFFPGIFFVQKFFQMCKI